MFEYTTGVIAKITFADPSYIISPRTGAKLLSEERYVAVALAEEVPSYSYATTQEAHVYLISIDRHLSLDESYLCPDEKIVREAGYESFDSITGDLFSSTIGFVNPALSCVVPIRVLEPLNSYDIGMFLKQWEEPEDFHNCVAVGQIQKFIMRELFNQQGWQTHIYNEPTGTSPRDAFIRNEIRDLNKIAAMLL